MRSQLLTAHRPTDAHPPRLMNETFFLCLPYEYYIKTSGIILQSETRPTQPIMASEGLGHRKLLLMAKIRRTS